MVTAVGALAGGFFEGEILAPVLVEQVADRRVAIGPVQHDATDDLQARAQRDRVGRIPAGRMHGADHVADVADALTRAQLEPDTLIVEVTESALTDDSGRVIRTLDELATPVRVLSRYSCGRWQRATSRPLI